jgi:hypothetical protein
MMSEITLHATLLVDRCKWYELMLCNASLLVLAANGFTSAWCCEAEMLIGWMYGVEALSFPDFLIARKLLAEERK